MATTRVNFSGMIGFVPNETKGDGKAVRVLFKDGGEPNFGPAVTSKDQFSDRENLFPHLAVVHFRLADLDPASPRRPDLTGNARGLCFLKYEELTLGSVVQGDRLKFEWNRLPPQGKGNSDDAESALATKTEHPQPKQATSNERRALLAEEIEMPDKEDLCWLLPPDAASGKAENTAAVNADCLKTPYRVRSAQVATGDNLLVARIRLNSGRLYTRQFRTKGVAGQRRMALCDFYKADASDPSKPDGEVLHSQCLATLVTWEPDGEEALVISSQSFDFDDDTSMPQRPELRFLKHEDRDVEVHVWNATVPDILSVIAAPGDEPGFQFPTGDRSFRAFYRLLDKPENLPAPLMQRHALIAATMTISDTESGKGVGCPLAGFADDPAA